MIQVRLRANVVEWRSRAPRNIKDLLLREITRSMEIGRLYSRESESANCEKIIRQIKRKYRRSIVLIIITRYQISFTVTSRGTRLTSLFNLVGTYARVCCTHTVHFKYPRGFKSTYDIYFNVISAKNVFVFSSLLCRTIFRRTKSWDHERKSGDFM